MCTINALIDGAGLQLKRKARLGPNVFNLKYKLRKNRNGTKSKWNIGLGQAEAEAKHNETQAETAAQMNGQIAKVDRAYRFSFTNRNNRLFCTITRYCPYDAYADTERATSS